MPGFDSGSSSGGGGGGGGASTIANGADVTQGALADAIVAAGASGSISAKLRRATQGLEDLKTLIVLATGTNKIGGVTVADGDQATIGAIADAIATAGSAGTLSAKLRRVTQGLEDLKTLVVLAAGANVIGGVTIANGSDVTTGAIADALVAAGATGSVSAKLRRATQGLEDLKTLIVLAAGTNVIGGVTIADGSHVTIGALADAIVAAGATGSVSAKLRRITQGLEDLKTLTVLAAGENHIGEIGGRTVTASDEFSRPADTTAYAANDAVSATVSNSATTALRGITLVRINNGSGYITKIRLWTNKNAITPRFRVHLYSVPDPAASSGTAVVGDNVALPLVFANRTLRRGYIDLPAMTSGQSGSDASLSQNIVDRIPFGTAASDAKLYYRLETLDGFTPDSGQTFYLAITVEQN